MVTKAIAPVLPLQQAVGERRRPGRVEYRDPNLIALLRRTAGSPVNNSAHVEHGGDRSPPASEAESVQPSRAGPQKPGLHLLSDGRRVDPTQIDGRRYTFVVSVGTRVLQLASQAEVSVARIVAITPTQYDVIPADHPDLRLGWGPSQTEGGAIWRSAQGTANLPLQAVTGGAMIEVHLKG